MKTNLLESLAVLSDEDLLARVQRLVFRERESTAYLVAHLAELEQRGLHLAQGNSSLFGYCTQVLHLSEHEAYGRIQAARAARRFPVILEMLENGSVHLTAVGLLAPHLSDDNHRELLAAARHKTKRQVEEIVAWVRPRPPVRASVRKVPTPKATAGPSDRIATEAAPESEPVGTAASAEVVTGSPPPPSSPHAPPPPSLPPRSAPPGSVAPLAPEQYKVQFTASAETRDKLRMAQDLLRHVVPDGDLAVVFDRALDALLAELLKRKAAPTDRPRSGRGTKPGSRTISAEVRREVWKRDGGRCTYVANNGRRCSETGMLEFHHEDAFARGGEATVENIHLRCRGHNAYQAQLEFGARATMNLREPLTRYGFAQAPIARRGDRRSTQLGPDRVPPAPSSHSRPPLVRSGASPPQWTSRQDHTPNHEPAAAPTPVGGV